MSPHTGITAKIRRCIKSLRCFRAADVIDALGNDVQTYSAAKRIKKVVFNLAQSGEIVRLERGLYEYRGKQGKPQLREVMWRILRARRVVTVDDLEELSGAKQGYVEEWLRMLERNGIVRHFENGRWQMIQDPVEMPGDEQKSERLRGIRERKRAALEAIARASGALEEARAALEEWEDEA